MRASRIDDEVPDPAPAAELGSDEWVLAEYEAMMADPACVNAKEEVSAKLKMAPRTLMRVVARARKRKARLASADTSKILWIVVCGLWLWTLWLRITTEYSIRTNYYVGVTAGW